MARLREVFARAANEKRAALIIYMCAGDPDLATTGRLLDAAAEAGADVIEIGMPFSDPTADGPVIQRASERALRSDTTLKGLLDCVRAFRARKPHTGIVLFGYYNPLLAFDEQEIAKAATQTEVDGFLIVDLPPEEGGSMREALAQNGLDFVPLIAPTTQGDRVQSIARSAGAFLYYVSLTGVTGAEADLGAAAKRAVAIRRQSDLPVAVGFGVKTADDARSLALAGVDGVVVGSAVCSAIEHAADADAAVQQVAELVRALRAACQR